MIFARQGGRRPDFTAARQPSACPSPPVVCCGSILSPARPRLRCSGGDCPCLVCVRSLVVMLSSGSFLLTCIMPSPHDQAILVAFLRRGTYGTDAWHVRKMTCPARAVLVNGSADTSCTLTETGRHHSLFVASWRFWPFGCADTPCTLSETGRHHSLSAASWRFWPFGSHEMAAIRRLWYVLACLCALGRAG